MSCPGTKHFVFLRGQHRKAIGRFVSKLEKWESFWVPITWHAYFHFDNRVNVATLFLSTGLSVNNQLQFLEVNWKSNQRHWFHLCSELQQVGIPKSQMTWSCHFRQGHLTTSNPKWFDVAAQPKLMYFHSAWDLSVMEIEWKCQVQNTSFFYELHKQCVSWCVLHLYSTCDVGFHLDMKPNCLWWKRYRSIGQISDCDLFCP